MSSGPGGGLSESPYAVPGTRRGRRGLMSGFDEGGQGLGKSRLIERGHGVVFVVLPDAHGNSFAWTPSSQVGKAVE